MTNTNVINQTHLRELTVRIQYQDKLYSMEHLYKLKSCEFIFSGYPHFPLAPEPTGKSGSDLSGHSTCKLQNTRLGPGVLRPNWGQTGENWGAQPAVPPLWMHCWHCTAARALPCIDQRCSGVSGASDRPAPALVLIPVSIKVLKLSQDKIMISS